MGRAGFACGLTKEHKVRWKRRAGKTEKREGEIVKRKGERER
jgi:hypothetical protein